MYGFQVVDFDLHNFTYFSNEFYWIRMKQALKERLATTLHKSVWLLLIMVFYAEKFHC